MLVLRVSTSWDRNGLLTRGLLSLVASLVIQISLKLENCLLWPSWTLLATWSLKSCCFPVASLPRWFEQMVLQNHPAGKTKGNLQLVRAERQQEMVVDLAATSSRHLGMMPFVREKEATQLIKYHKSKWLVFWYWFVFSVVFSN